MIAEQMESGLNCAIFSSFNCIDVMGIHRDTAILLLHTKRYCRKTCDTVVCTRDQLISLFETDIDN